LLSATSPTAVISQKYAASPIYPDVPSSLLFRSEASFTRACLKRQDKAFTCIERETGEKKIKRKNSYITRGIKGPVALSDGDAYKDRYLVIFSISRHAVGPDHFVVVGSTVSINIDTSGVLFHRHLFY
jgi:hypothetical protein